MTSRFEKIRGAMFDMDGTLLDSMPYWRKLNVDFLKARGLTAPMEIRADLLSTSNRVCASAYAGMDGLSMTTEEILAEYRRLMKRYYETEIVPKPGASDYVRRLRASGIKTCVATASPLALATMALDKHGMLKDFDFVVSAFDLKMKKEEPYFYRLAAEKLGLPCEECVMFEDALYAMHGARAAGLYVFGIAEEIQARQRSEIEAFCDAFAENYDDFPKIGPILP